MRENAFKGCFKKTGEKHVRCLKTIRKRIGSDDFNDMSESLLKLQIEKYANQQKERLTEISG